MVKTSASKTSASIKPKKYNAMAYYRLSKYDSLRGGSSSARSDSFGYESDSISNQRKLVHAYIKNNPNIVLVGEEYDDGYTGTNFDRPGFRAVLDRIQNGEVNCVIVKDLSRLGREYIETGKYLEMIFPHFGVRFIAINDDVDSFNSSAGDDIIIPVKNIMNESYCRELSRKLRRQFKVQRENGEFISPFAGYGYRKAPEDKHKLVIDEYAAEVIKSIFSMKLRGFSQQAIADFLNGEGILSPSEYKKSLGLNYKTGFKGIDNSKWGAVTVRSILTNPLYIGTLIQGKRGTPNYKVKKMMTKNPEDWIVVENNHDAIIEPVIFNIVQKMMGRDTRTSPGEEAVFPLAGMVFCADCKSPMCRRSVMRSGRKFYYYICTLNKRGKGCTSHSVSQGKLETAVLHAIGSQVHIAAELRKLIHERGKHNIEDIKAKRLECMIAGKQQEIEKCRDFKLKLYEALNDKVINYEEYTEMRQKYTDMIETAQSASDRMSRQLTIISAGTDKAHDILTLFSKFEGLNKLTREAVVTLIDRIYVYEDKKVKIDFNYRDEIAYYENILNYSEKEAN